VPVTKPLPAFPGIILRYEEGENPNFEIICVEALTRLKEFNVGIRILALIADSAPESVPNDQEAPDFPREFGCKVLMIPTHERVMIQDGYRRVWGNLVPTNGPPGLRPFNPSPLSGSCNAAASPAEASAGGSVCTVRFNNTIMKTSQGEMTTPFVVLGHELIHSVHALYGETLDGRAEELRTTGLEQFSREELSENKLRLEAGLQLRTQY